MDAHAVTVFFYGLFMDESLLASKGVLPRNSAIAYVDGFSLHIGNRATLLPEEKARAYGVLMEILREDAAALYSDESVSDYVAQPVIATLPDGSAVSAVSYNLPATRLTGTNPEYASALLELASRLGLPESYLEHIRVVALNSD